MRYLKIKNNTVVGKPFTLPTNYITEDGRAICGVENLTLEEKLAEGLYSLVEIVQPEFDSSYQELKSSYTINSDSVSVAYSVIDVQALFEPKITKILIDFAHEKDMILAEIDILKHSTNAIWKQNAETFSRLYDATWQAYYAYTGTSWQELEATLPPLVW